MSERKMVRKSVAIALGIICIILIAGIVEIWLSFLVRDIEKDETITNLNIEVFNKGFQISQLNSNVTSLQDQINNLTNIVNLANSTVWVNNQTISQPQDSWYNWTFVADYPGYISVQVYYSTVLNPVAEVVYTYHGINYDQQTEGTTEAFPVMPSNIEIRLGNGPHVLLYDAKTGLLIVPTVNETVTIAYYY